MIEELNKEKRQLLNSWTLELANWLITEHSMKRSEAFRKAHLTRQLLRMKKNYTYDAATGRLTSSRLGRAVRGKKCNNNGYLSVHCRLDKRRVFIYLHHAVWAVCKGCWPTQQIDHINGDKTDNRIENLREVCGSENKMNMLHPWKPNAKTGLPGVSPNGNKFQTSIYGKSFYFHDPYEAFYHLTLLGRRYKGNERLKIKN